MLKQQQQQTEVLLRQIQTQMEADMRLKSEMTRNQLQVLTEMQLRNPSDQVPSVHAMLANLPATNKDVEEVYKEKESRLRSLHQEEIEDLTHRLRVANDKLVTAKAEHEDELEAERERRVRDLARQSEEHCRAVESLRAEYMTALDKVKEIRARELDSLKDATDITR